MSTVDLDTARDAVFATQTNNVPPDAIKVQGPNFDQPIELLELLKSYERIGFQATGLSRAIKIVEEMIDWRKPESEDEDGSDVEAKHNADPEASSSVRPGCDIFLGYTSNLVSSGLREVILFLVKHRLVKVLVTTAGGIEEDLIKCLGPGTFIPQTDGFSLKGETLRKQGLNRIGNLLAPNEGYCRFEDWILPRFTQMLQEQQEKGITWTPSKFIERLGLEIDNEESIYYWAAKNGIPVFCPALTDGSIGDMLYFHSYKHPGLIIDINQDIRRLNDLALKAACAGIIILGGGVCKHQICNAMLFRNGAEFAVYINTGQEFDGSDAGARPDEAISWGKIKATAHHVKISADATLIFPLLVAATFAKHVHNK